MVLYFDPIYVFCFNEIFQIREEYGSLFRNHCYYCYNRTENYATSHLVGQYWQWQDQSGKVTIYRMDAIMYGIIAAWISYYKNWKNDTLLFGIGIFIFV